MEAVEASMSAALLRDFSGRQKNLVAGVRALVGQESPTGDPSATTAIIAKLKTRLDAIGAATKLHQTERGAHLVGGMTFGQSLHDSALMIAALEAIHELELKPWREIRILLSCDEESGSTTSRDLIASEPSHSAAVFVLELSCRAER